MGRAVFLDVDGTLVAEDGRVPESASAAGREARANGHRVFLSTGRCLAQLWPDVLDIGFDGLIAGAGAYGRAGDEVLVRHTLPADAIRRVREFFDPRGVEFYFEGHEGVYGTPRTRERLRRLVFDVVDDPEDQAVLVRGPFAYITAMRVDAGPLEGVSKVMYMDADLPIETVRAAFAGVFDVVPSSVSRFGARGGEMSLPGVHKAAGVEVLCDHLGIDREHTIALGDSYNDLEMLAHAAVGIAMGNAPQPVLEAADEVTAAPERDGVRLAFVRHGLIAP